MATQSILEHLATRRFIHIPAPNPVFIAGKPGEWDENYVECCNVIKDGDTHGQMAEDVKITATVGAA